MPLFLEMLERGGHVDDAEGASNMARELGERDVDHRRDPGRLSRHDHALAVARRNGRTRARHRVGQEARHGRRCIANLTLAIELCFERAPRGEHASDRDQCREARRALDQRHVALVLDDDEAPPPGCARTRSSLCTRAHIRGTIRCASRRRRCAPVDSPVRRAGQRGGAESCDGGQRSAIREACAITTPNTACIATLDATHAWFANDGAPTADSGSTIRFITR